MKSVLIAKIGSNKIFRDELLNSGDQFLVETLADPWWGCGLPYHIAIKTNPNHYPGSNKLGQLLMELRGEMQADHSAHPLIEHTGHNCVESPERQRSIKQICSKLRSSSVPVHYKEKNVTKLFQLLLSRICFAGNPPNTNVRRLQHRIQRTMFLKMKPHLVYLPPTHLVTKTRTSFHVTS